MRDFKIDYKSGIKYASGWVSLKRNRSVAAGVIYVKVMEEKEKDISCLVGTLSRQALISLSNVIIIHTEFHYPETVWNWFRLLV